VVTQKYLSKTDIAYIQELISTDSYLQGQRGRGKWSPPPGKEEGGWCITVEVCVHRGKGRRRKRRVPSP